MTLLIRFSVLAQLLNNFLDPTFGANGLALGNLGNQYSLRFAAALVQPDDKIVVAGTVDSAYEKHGFVMRFNSNGSVDYTFAGGGYVAPGNGYVRDSIMAIARQSDGKILAAGLTASAALQPYHVLVVRYNVDGSVDQTFGTGGRLELSSGSRSLLARAITVQADDQILVGGYMTTGSGVRQFMIARLNASDGTLDQSFGTYGVVTAAVAGYDDQVYALAVQPDGQILVAGIAFTQPLSSPYSRTSVLARYTASGSPDLTFGTNGRVIKSISRIVGYDLVRAVGLQSDGSIIVAGTAQTGGSYGSDFASWRYTPDGRIDSTYGFNGISLVDFENRDDEGYGMTINATDQVIMTGRHYSNFVDHVATCISNSDGNPYIQWSSQGRTYNSMNGERGDDRMYSVMTQSDGRIVVAGSSSQPGNVLVGMQRYYYSLPTTGMVGLHGAVLQTYPDPAATRLHVSLGTAASQATCTIYAVTGQELLSHPFAGISTDIDVEHLAPGIYTLRIHAPGTAIDRSFVIAR